jgi:hypothetical protein
MDELVARAFPGMTGRQYETRMVTSRASGYDGCRDAGFDAERMLEFEVARAAFFRAIMLVWSWLRRIGYLC